MTDDVPQPIQSPPARGFAASLHPLMATLPAGAFTASVLFDVLGLVAANPEQAHSYQRGAAELLTVGLGSVLTSVALELADALLAPGNGPNAVAARPFAVNGALIAIYLLDVAARRKQVSDVSTRPALADAAPIGLSLLGLAVLGISTKRT